jgi:hypothetical protein
MCQECGNLSEHDGGLGYLPGVVFDNEDFIQCEAREIFRNLLADTAGSVEQIADQKGPFCFISTAKAPGVIEIIFKVCTKCGGSKPISEFYYHPKGKYKRNSWCKSCTNFHATLRQSSGYVPPAGVLEPPGMKVCSTCGGLKVLSEFYFSKGGKYQRSGSCKICTRAAEKERHHKNKVLKEKKNRASGGMKLCYTCKKTKEVSEFSRDKYSKDGFKYECRECSNRKAGERYEKNRERFSDVEIMGTKVCYGCGLEKDLSLFYKGFSSKDRHRSYCIDCEKEMSRLRNEEAHVEVDLTSSQICCVCGENKLLSEFYLEKRIKTGVDNMCKECRRLRGRQRTLTLHFVPDLTGTKLCRLCGEEKPAIEFFKYKNHKDGLCSYCKTCTRKLHSASAKSNPAYRAIQAVRHRLAKFVKGRGGDIDKDVAIDFLGCTAQEFYDYLEGHFYRDSRSGREMTWENYGCPEGRQADKQGWDYDHVIPLTKIDWNDESQIKQVCYFSNIKPLWHWENNTKSAKLPEGWTAEEWIGA